MIVNNDKDIVTIGASLKRPKEALQWLVCGDSVSFARMAEARPRVMKAVGVVAAFCGSHWYSLVGSMHVKASLCFLPLWQESGS